MAATSNKEAPSRPRSARLLRGVILGGVALLAILALAAWWLLGSGSGRDFALRQAMGALPEGALRVGEREGSLAGGLRLRDVVYEDDAVRVDIASMEVWPGMPGLEGPTVTLSSLRLRGVQIRPKDVPDEPTPPWPDVLPTLDLPVALRIDAIDVRDVVVHAVDEAAEPMIVDRLTAALALQPGRLALDGIALDAPQGRLRGALSYAPSEDFQSRLALDAQLAAGAQLALQLDGGLAEGRATVEGHAGGPVTMAFDWKDAARVDTLAWTLGVEATGLALDTLGLPAQAPIDAVLEANAGVGSAGAAPGFGVALEGRVSQEGFVVQMRDSRVRLHEGVVHAEPVSLSLLDGRLDLTGTYALDDGAMALMADAEALAWGDGDARVQADGGATLTGTIETWAADLDVGLARGEQRATLTGRARGDAEAIVLSPFTLATPGGAFEGEARYSLDAAAGFLLEAQMRGLDPAWLVPEWSGRINARVRVEGAAPADAPLSYVAELAPLEGTLRGQRIGGEARVEAAGEASKVEAALALGDGRIAVQGDLAPTMALDINVRALNVAPWVDGARGVLDGRVRIRGDAGQPSLDTDLALLDGGWDDIALQRLGVRGSLPARGNGRIDVRVEALSQADHRIDAIDMAIEGRVDDGRFTLDTRGIAVGSLPVQDPSERGRFEARGAWTATERFTRGELRLEALEAALPALPGLRLADPAALVWRDADWSLPAPACLALGEGGRVCAQGDANEARVSGEALDLAWLAPFLPDDLETPVEPSGVVALQADRRRVDGAFLTTARIASAEGRLRVAGATPETVFGWRGLQLEAEHSDGWRVDVRADLLPEGRLEARASADVAGVLDGEIKLRASDLSLLEVVTADVVAPQGAVDGRLVLSGTVEAPRWQGAVVAAPFAVELPALGIAVVDGDLRVEGGDDGQLRLRGRLPTGDGALEITGQWSDDERPNRVAIRGTDVRVLDTPDGRAWISPVIDVELADGVAKVRGRVDVPRAELALDRFEQQVTSSSDVVIVDDPAVDESLAGVQLDADLIVALGDDVRLRGFGFDGRLSGELKLRDRVDREPRVRGTLELAGGVRAYGQQLDLERGTLRWGNVAIDEPTIDVRAVRPDSEPEVGVAVTGTGVSPIVDVWSRPALPQAEALSWLMFGRPLAAADGDDAAQLEQAATSLGGSAVAQAVAGKVGLDTASVGESRALGGTALTVGKRISPKLYVSYGMALSGTGQVVTVTYALRRWLAAQLETGIEQRIELEAKFERD